MAFPNTPPIPTTAQGICIAFSSPWSVDNATSGGTAAEWTRIDDPSVASLSIGGADPTSPSHVVVSWTADRGRQYELDTTQTGTATINIVDTSGLFDPTGDSPYAPLLGSMKRAVINVQNPVTGNYQDVFSGYVETYTWAYTDQTKSVVLVTINLVDGFDVLNRAEVVPDSTGYYTLLGQQVRDRILLLLSDAEWPLPTGGSTTGLVSINTGNTNTIGYQYNSGTSILSTIQDAADAEFPGVANFFMDRHGNATFRGRWPRFIPEAYGNQVAFWNVGDAGYSETFGYIPISDMEFTIDQTLLYNTSLCYPYNFPQFGYPNQLATDTGSIDQYGVRQITLNDLLCGGAVAEPENDSDHPYIPPGGNPTPATDGPGECLAYAQYYVDNFADPAIRISSITFKTVQPLQADSPSDGLWFFLTNVEIGDVINVFTSPPGEIDVDTVILDGQYQGNQFFVDGIHHQVNPLNENYPDWTMTLDLSPRTWYTTFKGNTYYPGVDGFDPAPS